jgi:membrane protease YdiL (CAAX protease family)
VQRPLFWLAIAWIAAVLFLRREDWKDLGLDWRSSLRLLWLPGIVCILGAAVTAAAHLFLAGEFHLPARLFRGLQARAGGYFVWAVMQQIVLEDVVLLRMLRLAPNRRWAVGIAAALFAAAHLPNPMLTILTIVWGTASCVLFLRYRGIFALGAAHAILGLTVGLVVPARVDHHMRVGLGYLTYRAHRGRHLRSGDSPKERDRAG